ncbi:DUF6036 family nucleotidyltransferase [Pseudidiomarina mangrovi]|uniref:DUF6036 family nucleotidyltransferase n=1 Tax=Pseudidiomarina mangrovi TaxID=2487133 RepID=UPI000FCAFEE6|nr:DUF6036 family nucleotidyltransferase [Pseudidiomarina mangrovi]
MPINTSSPLSQAIIELLQNIDQELTEQLAAAPGGAIKAYIFGGCATHLFVNSRASNDLDVAMVAKEGLNIGEIKFVTNTAYYDHPDYGPSLIEFDKTFNVDSTPVVSPDYRDRAIPLETGNKYLDCYVANPVDIAVSKLSRCAADDVSDILALYTNGCFTIESFAERGYEAAEYHHDPEKLRSNIEHVILQLKKHQQ